MSVQLRLMTKLDLPMLHDWLNRAHVLHWWGGDDARPSLDEVRAHYLPRVIAPENVTPYIAELDGRPIGYAQSYVAAGSGDGWWEQITDPGVRGIDQFLANGAELGRGLGSAMVGALVDRLLADPAVSLIQTDPDPSNARAIRCYEKVGFVGQGEILTPDGAALYMTLSRAQRSGVLAAPAA